MALFAPDMALADERLSALRVSHARNRGAIDFPAEAALDYLFLAGRNQSPTDLPEHFAQANTAESLIRIWLAGDDLSRERQLLQGLGATLTEVNLRVPERVRATLARLREGDVLLLPGSQQLVAGRRVVGHASRRQPRTGARDSRP